jgi:Na+-transporting methylmalonyl-CoA/oxaloacetate decarboxylase gamma subunit
MSLLDSILVSLFGIGIVFIVLAILSAVLKIQSNLFRLLAKENKQIEQYSEVECKEDLTYGEVQLVGVDDRTAALIMAIVSDEMKTPLEELHFKYIKSVS